MHGLVNYVLFVDKSAELIADRDDNGSWNRFRTDWIYFSYHHHPMPYEQLINKFSSDGDHFVTAPRQQKQNNLWQSTNETVTKWGWPWYCSESRLPRYLSVIVTRRPFESCGKSVVRCIVGRWNLSSFQRFVIIPPCAR